MLGPQSEGGEATEVEGVSGTVALKTDFKPTNQIVRRAPRS